MASLLTMNNEVIREIGMCLLDDNYSLCALALTYRSLYMVIHTLIVRNINLRVQGSYDVGILEQYDQLIRTLDSRPDLCTNIRSLRLIWGCDGPSHDTNKDAANGRANRLLSLTPSIRSLDISNYSYKCSPFAPPFDLLLNFHLLKQISTSNYKTTVWEVAHLMRVPSLQVLKVQYMNVRMKPGAQKIPHSATQPLATHLTQLTLAPHSNLSPSALQSLLTIASNIRSLTINVPGLQSKENPRGGHRRRDIRMLEDLSPAGLLTCLRPVRKTLVECALSNVGRRWPGHDGSRLDLRSFTHMRKVSLCAACVFVPDESWESRKGLGELLPKTIEDVVIEFEDSHGFLYTTAEIETDTPNALSWAAPERYSWLTELVANPASVPNLRHLTIKERLESSRGLHFKRVRWEPPTILKAQFQSRGWEVQVWVRGPKTINPPTYIGWTYFFHPLND